MRVIEVGQGQVIPVGMSVCLAGLKSIQKPAARWVQS
jgi:hypothetical protein